MKPTKIKAWPELIDFLPSLQALTEHGARDLAIRPDIEVDFGAVRAVTSTGLAVFLLRLMRLVGDRTAQIRPEIQPGIRQQLEHLGAFQMLQTMAKSSQNELSLGHAPTHPVVFWDNNIANVPLYRLHFDNCEDRRQPVYDFVSWLSLQLTPLLRDYDVVPGALIMLLNEIAKNAADHAHSDALFGFDLSPMNETCARATFAFGDLGIGIKRHIELHLPPGLENRAPKWSLYEAYRLALKPGYTSNVTSSINKGHGMSIIVDCAFDLQVHLSIFDAASRGLLNSFERGDKPTHSAVRRIFHNVGHDVGFFYFGDFFLQNR